MSLSFCLQYKVEENKEIKVLSRNITHNLGLMAQEAGIYNMLWHPEVVQAVYAKDIIEGLQESLQELRATPERFRTFNPENGWGDYQAFVQFVEAVLTACEEYPNATIYVSR